jgi:hypothetical protein
LLGNYSEYLMPLTPSARELVAWRARERGDEPRDFPIEIEWFHYSENIVYPPAVRPTQMISRDHTPRRRLTRRFVATPAQAARIRSETGSVVPPAYLVTITDVPAVAGVRATAPAP